ncbi:hypothetical protein NPIL_344121 [Nephila pilipes]|uniref:Uncharacterized protein n=1 Tax=Nephila pilipes TaxID=299642 RepID=A0A8X6PBP6_NEPPI|nr:hypothetical protein NPIL_344121 [Nephila pilipes]
MAGYRSYETNHKLSHLATKIAALLNQAVISQPLSPQAVVIFISAIPLPQQGTNAFSILQSRRYLFYPRQFRPAGGLV